MPDNVVTIRLRLRLGGGDIVFRRLEAGGEGTEIKRQRWQGDWIKVSSGVLDLVAGEMDRGCRRFAVDMEQLTWINSDGLGQLILWHKQITEAGGRLVFAAPSARVKRIFDVSQVDRVLSVYPRLDEALAVLTTAEGAD